jgi:glycosyltransferase involved in cell wall biosynthesis
VQFPEISVVMPVYNRAHSVARSVRSVLAQTMGNFELIVVDDGSTDTTAEVIEAIADGRISLIRQPRNAGANASRNCGILAAKAAIVSFLDSDDEFLPTKLGYVAEYFRKHAGTDVLIDSYELLGARTGQNKPKARRNPVMSDSLAVRRAVFNRHIFKATPSISARKESLVTAGLFDESLRRRQDMDLVLRLTEHARCATTDSILWRKHWSADAISAEQNTFMRAMIDMCERHPEYLTDPGLRPGLSRDFTRHHVRLAMRGRLAIMYRDARAFCSFTSGPFARGLFLAGCVEMAKRAEASARRPLQAASGKVLEEKSLGNSAKDLKQAL